MTSAVNKGHASSMRARPSLRVRLGVPFALCSGCASSTPSGPATTAALVPLGAAASMTDPQLLQRFFGL
ncbi:MAG: hypothetical protein IPN77_32910 [Sandaracinaceae bacterium]|nr:hypothetical protein [Sandaracinaceae bacterium]